MGKRLREMYGREMVTFGFAFNQGAFQAITVSGLQEFTVEPAPEDTLDAALATAGTPISALPLRDAPDWFGETQCTRTISAGYSPTWDCFLPVKIT